MEQINKISKQLCDANVRLTWPGFAEECDKPKGKGKKKRKKKKKEEAAGEREQEESKEVNKKTKLECEACTHGPRGPGNARRAALWCCTRCALMFCGAMRMFVAAAGVLGLCLTMFFIFTPSEEAKPSPSPVDAP